MIAPRDVTGEEELGRRVYSGRAAQRASRSRVPLTVFLEKAGVSGLSSDRLSIAPPAEAIAIAVRDGIARSASFYGWAVVTADQASQNGRRAVATPQPDNPYHADIRLPELSSEDHRDEQKRHAQELADPSTWRGRPAEQE